MLYTREIKSRNDCFVYCVDMLAKDKGNRCSSYILLLAKKTECCIIAYDESFYAHIGKR